MTLAVYTTVYPGVEVYFADWCRSLREQTDREFQLWIGLDMLRRETVQTMLGDEFDVHWVVCPPGATIAEVRQQALEAIVETASGVVLVDSDDLLHPSRLERARVDLGEAELAGCALCLVDHEANDLGVTFNLPAELKPDDVFPRNNIFGFSNSSFRADLLRRCLPIPSSAVLVDWFLATRAWLLGARLAFDRVPRMDYRQHPRNTARVRSPFCLDQVISDTSLVRQHFQLVLANPEREFLDDRLAAVRSAAADVEAFHRNLVLHAARLHDYVQALNNLNLSPLWWSSVANPALQYMWKS